MSLPAQSWWTSFSRYTFVNTGRKSSSDDSESTQALQRTTKLTSTVLTATTDGHPSSSTPLLNPTVTVEISTPETRERQMPLSMSLLSPSVFVAKTSASGATSPNPEMIPESGPAAAELAGLYSSVMGSPPQPGPSTNGTLDKIEGAYAAAKDFIAPFEPIVKTAADVVGQTTIGKFAKEGFDKFYDGIPIFAAALEAVADLHPCLKIVVAVFKHANELELVRFLLTNRDNDRKIAAVYVEMRDMMSVLIYLKDVRKDEVKAPDGKTTVEDRFGSLLEGTKSDIMECSNVCDKYSMKRPLAKAVMAKHWDETFLSYVKKFSQRRQEFHLELAIHTCLSVDKAIAKIDALDDKISAKIDEKMDVFMAMFQQLVSPEQRKLRKEVADKGGEKGLRGNDKDLDLLEKQANKFSNAPSVDGHRSRRTKDPEGDLNMEDLRNDVFEDPETAAKNNRNAFNLKFEALQRDTVDRLSQISRVVPQVGDHILHNKDGGPHERILDRSIRELWTQMNWRGGVKARHFVLALQEYYLEKFSESTTISGTGTTARPSPLHPDAWAIKHIDIMRLQPILEAFDDDASGFITITEMNHFTTSKPEEWSLPHWLAFWAVGHRWSIMDYAHKIEELFAKMEGVRAHVLPANRATVNDYFENVWRAVHKLTAAAPTLRPGPTYPEKFDLYVEREEARLAAQLEGVKYNIDGMVALKLITCESRIETCVFPLLYLLVKRHYEIMRIMRNKVVDSADIWEAADSILYVHDAISHRVDDLTHLFSQQKLDPEKYFQSFAHGIFKYFHNEKPLWSEDSDYFLDFDIGVIPYDDANENQGVNPEEVLKHKYRDEMSLEYWVYDGHTIDDVPNYPDVEPPLNYILGQWHGYFYDAEGAPEANAVDSMITVVLEPAEVENEVKASGWSSRGRHTTTGSWSKDENDIVKIKLKMSFRLGRLWFPLHLVFNGSFDSNRDALTGFWDYSDDSENPTGSGRMEFRRLQPRYLALYPSIKKLLDNKPRALWKFAIAAVLNDVRRDRWSWSYFSERRDDRKTVISLAIRHFFGSPLDEGERRKLSVATQHLTSADACFYDSIVGRQRAHTCAHTNVTCDSCGGGIGDARLFCLDCMNKAKDRRNTLDLCSGCKCLAARITHRKDIEGPHEPHHRLVKARTFVLSRQFDRVVAGAQYAFVRVETSCKKIAEVHEQSEKKEEKAGAHAKSVSGAGSTDDHVGNGLPNPDGTRSGDSEGKDVGDTTQERGDGNAIQASDLPTCRKCEQPLSFPFWCCIVCMDDVLLCDACDQTGVPKLPGTPDHTEEHHLIRCLAPRKDEETTASVERRLVALEGQLYNIHVRFDDLSSRFGTLEQLLHDLHGLARGAGMGSVESCP